MAPTRFGDGACGAPTIGRASCSATATSRRGCRRDHSLRAVRAIVNEALSTLDHEFAALCSPVGRPSIPPEKLLRAMLLQAFYSIRSERLLMERLECDLLFRWFVEISIDNAASNHSVFSKNRDGLLEGDIAAQLSGSGAGAAQGEEASIERSLLARWHADRGLALDEERQAEGRLLRPSRPFVARHFLNTETNASRSFPMWRGCATARASPRDA